MKTWWGSTNGIAVLFFIVVLAGCVPAVKPDDVVEYRVSGTTPIAGMITIAAKDGTEQYSDVELPWSYSFTTYSARDRFLYVSAQNGMDSGTITVEIVVNGTVVKSASSTGAYVIATASQ